MVVEGANTPLTPGADAVADGGVSVVPDALANAGGVVVSYLEWVQNIQNCTSWERRQVDEELPERQRPRRILPAPKATDRHTAPGRAPRRGGAAVAPPRGDAEPGRPG